MGLSSSLPEQKSQSRIEVCVMRFAADQPGMVTDWLGQVYWEPVGPIRSSTQLHFSRWAVSGEEVEDILRHTSSAWNSQFEGKRLNTHMNWRSRVQELQHSHAFGLCLLLTGRRIREDWMF